MKPEVITTISTLVAVLLGFSLSQLSEYFGRKTELKSQKNNIHNLIEKETKQNITLLTDFWALVIERLDEASPNEESQRTSTLAKILGRSPLPCLSTHVWHSNLNERPRFFTQNEIDNLWQFYQLLFEIERKKEFFDYANESRVQSIQHEKSRRGPATGFISELGFYEQIKQHVSIFEEMINKAITSKITNV